MSFDLNQITSFLRNYEIVKLFLYNYSERLKLTQSMQSSGRLEVSPDSVYDFTSEDLQDLGEIGRGAFGTVNKMVHRKSNTVMAVKVCYGSV